MKSVYLTKNQKTKQLDALKIPTGRKVDDLSTLSVARMTTNTLLTRVKDQDVTMAMVCTNNNSGFFTLVVTKTSKLP